MILVSTKKKDKGITELFNFYNLAHIWFSFGNLTRKIKKDCVNITSNDYITIPSIYSLHYAVEQLKLRRLSRECSRWMLHPTPPWMVCPFIGTREV